MTIAAGRIWREWPHRLQSSRLVLEPTVARNVAVDEEKTPVTAGDVYQAIEVLRRVLKEPQKHPEVKTVFAKDG